MREEQERKRKEKSKDLINKLKDVYWEENGDEDLDVIWNSMQEYKNLEITEEETKQIFYMLPQNIFGLGIQWGFSDTEVRDQIYVFIEENMENVMKEIS